MSSAKWQQKLKFLEIILKVHPTKREVFENLNHINFVIWPVPKSQNSISVKSLASEKSFRLQ